MLIHNSQIQLKKVGKILANKQQRCQPSLPAEPFADEDPHPFELLSSCIVADVWSDARDGKQWFLGCMVEQHVARVDHIVGIQQGHEQWKYPWVPDMCDIGQTIGQHQTRI